MTEFINPNEDTRIEAGSKVELHFSVAIESGPEIDNTRSRAEPVSLVMGDGSLLPGFEKALFGLRAGDRRTVSLPPEEAFGPWNPENVQTFDTVKFEQRPVEGHMIEFEVLKDDNLIALRGETARLFLNERGYQRALQSQELGEIHIISHALVIEGHIIRPKKKRHH